MKPFFFHLLSFNQHLYLIFIGSSFYSQLVWIKCSPRWLPKELYLPFLGSAHLWGQQLWGRRHMCPLWRSAWLQRAGGIVRTQTWSTVNFLWWCIGTSTSQWGIWGGFSLWQERPFLVQNYSHCPAMPRLRLGSCVNTAYILQRNFYHCEEEPGDMGKGYGQSGRSSWLKGLIHSNIISWKLKTRRHAQCRNVSRDLSELSSRGLLNASLIQCPLHNLIAIWPSVRDPFKGGMHPFGVPTPLSTGTSVDKYRHTHTHTQHCLVLISSPLGLI